MIYQWWPQALLIASILIIVVIVGRKYRTMRETSDQEISARKRNMQKRKRKIDWVAFLKNIWQNIFTILRGAVRYIVKILASLITWLSKKTGHKIVVKSEHKVGSTVVEAPIAVSKQEEDQSVSYLISKASKCLESNEIDQAEELYLKAVPKDPKNVEIYLGLGTIYSKRNNFGDAKASFRQVLKIDPENKEAHSEILKMDQVDEKLENGK